jgi:cobalt-precorrin-5B (C1)-methyltransferase
MVLNALRTFGGEKRKRDGLQRQSVWCFVINLYRWVQIFLFWRDCLEQFVYKEQKRLRCGYTTGSCAAAAAKAAARMLLSGEMADHVCLDTPKGIALSLPILDITKGDTWVSCAVQKDSGDDPDITNGILVYAKVQREEGDGITIDGGIGVGRVTKKGLDQPVGAAAINTVPRKMIAAAVSQIQEELEDFGGLFVEISVPEGEAVSRQTFNPHLGIVGGISILGTSGIVEPMSEQALIDTIRTECHVRKAAGDRLLLLSPGNYGVSFLQQQFPFLPETAVKCSNFIGEAIDIGVELGFSRLLLVGHIGKLVKVGGGIFQTHSRNADSRLEILASCGLRAGVSADKLRQLLSCVTTDGALSLLQGSGDLQPVMEVLLQRIQYYLERRSGGKMEIGAVVFSNEFGCLGKTAPVQKWLEEQI